MSRAGQSGAAAGGFGGSSSFIDKVVEGIAESEASLDSNQQFLNLVAQARSNPVAQKAIQEIYLGLEASPAKQAEVEAIAGEYLKPAEAVEAAEEGPAPEPEGGPTRRFTKRKGDRRFAESTFGGKKWADSVRLREDLKTSNKIAGNAGNPYLIPFLKAELKKVGLKDKDLRGIKSVDDAIPFLEANGLPADLYFRAAENAEAKMEAQSGTAAGEMKTGLERGNFGRVEAAINEAINSQADGGRPVIDLPSVYPTFRADRPNVDIDGNIVRSDYALNPRILSGLMAEAVGKPQSDAEALTPIMLRSLLQYAPMPPDAGRSYQSADGSVFNRSELDYAQTQLTPEPRGGIRILQELSRAKEGLKPAKRMRQGTFIREPYQYQGENIPFFSDGTEGSTPILLNRGNDAPAQLNLDQPATPAEGDLGMLLNEYGPAAPQILAGLLA